MSDPIDRVPGTSCFDVEKITLLRVSLPTDDELEQRAGQLKALAHPGRLAAVSVLAQEECCVCDVANALDQPVSTVSEHLRRLKQANLVTSRREGRFVYYTLRPGPLTNAALDTADGLEAARQ